MAYSNAVRLLFEDVRTVGFATIAAAGAAYSGVGTVLEHPARMIIIQNFTDASLMFSTNGTTAKFALVNGGQLVLDIAANKTREQGFYFGEGDRLYVTEIGTPTTGSVYFSVLYGKV